MQIPRLLHTGLRPNIRKPLLTSHKSPQTAHINSNTCTPVARLRNKRAKCLSYPSGEPCIARVSAILAHVIYAQANANM